MGTIANIIGTLGVLSILLAFFQQQRGVMASNDMRYLLLNFWGALAIVFSLFWQWNLPAFLIETAWALISAHSIWKLKQNK